MIQFFYNTLFLLLFSCPRSTTCFSCSFCIRYKLFTFFTTSFFLFICFFGRWETPHPCRCVKRWKRQQNFEKTGRPPAAAIPAKGAMTGAQRFCAEALKDTENAARATSMKKKPPSPYVFKS